jgi:hypothetical protein
MKQSICLSSKHFIHRKNIGVIHHFLSQYFEFYFAYFKRPILFETAA